VTGDRVALAAGLLLWLILLGGVSRLVWTLT